MRILAANYRYFISGGPERYLFNVSDALRSRNHEVVPFSICYEQNVATPYSSYFASPIGAPGEVYLRDQRRTPRSLIKTVSRSVYSFEVERAIARLCSQTKPEVAYVLHYLRKLSPSLLVGLKKSGVPIVVRLSDYGMLCPQAHMLRESQPCRLCVNGDLLPSIKHKCVQGSRMASTINAFASWFHRWRSYFDLVDTFVVTNRFMQQQMLSAGYAENRVRLIPTFVNTTNFHGSQTKENYIAYSGRLEFIKGLHILIDSLVRLHQSRPDLAWTLRIAGTGDPGYVDSLKARLQASDLAHRVEFVGNLDQRGLAEFVARARLQVIPSIWYENLPNSLLEAFASRTPVVASAIGSLQDAIVDGQTGFLFAPGDAEALAKVLARALDSTESELTRMASRARTLAETDYSEQRHIEALEGLLVSIAHVS